MFQIDLMSRTPIYEQLEAQTEKLIAADILKPLDKMPSVRSLSSKLSVNPNTIQRAYTDMCNKGILISMVGRGYYVTEDARKIIRAQAQKKFAALDMLVNDLLAAGITKEELSVHISALLEGEEK